MLQSVVETMATTLKLPYVAIELAGKEGRLSGATTGAAVAETAEFPLRYQNEKVGYLVSATWWCRRARRANRLRSESAGCWRI